MTLCSGCSQLHYCPAVLYSSSRHPWHHTHMQIRCGHEAVVSCCLLFIYYWPQTEGVLLFFIDDDDEDGRGQIGFSHWGHERAPDWLWQKAPSCLLADHWRCNKWQLLLIGLDRSLPLPWQQSPLLWSLISLTLWCKRIFSESTSRISFHPRSPDIEKNSLHNFKQRVG